MIDKETSSSTDPNIPDTPGAAAQYYQKKQFEKDQVRKVLESFPETDVPDPPDDDTNK